MFHHNCLGSILVDKGLEGSGNGSVSHASFVKETDSILSNCPANHRVVMCDFQGDNNAGIQKGVGSDVVAKMVHAYQGSTNLLIDKGGKKFKPVTLFPLFLSLQENRVGDERVTEADLDADMVSRNIDLVYGRGSIGLMGLISQAVFDGGRHVIGVIPKTLMPREGPLLCGSSKTYNYSKSDSGPSKPPSFEFMDQGFNFKSIKEPVKPSLSKKKQKFRKKKLAKLSANPISSFLLRSCSSISSSFLSGLIRREPAKKISLASYSSGLKPHLSHL
ncbi:hypothetical protein REPUB_Repub17cG0023800 [Reevesia pubescens]